MQITEKLNDAQQELPEEMINYLTGAFPVFQEMVDAGYEVDYYSISGFAGITIVPKNNRIRVKANRELMSQAEYGALFAKKIKSCFDKRFENSDFLEGKKISLRFGRIPKSLRKKTYKRGLK